ncbi:hypothetical protein C8Q77DRAFT_779509 [Trametes polyzona]|nr:hypothetical protein C8Q77DRAFT_779509 [Trametes polyzona]
MASSATSRQEARYERAALRFALLLLRRLGVLFLGPSVSLGDKDGVGICQVTAPSIGLLYRSLFLSGRRVLVQFCRAPVASLERRIIVMEAAQAQASREGIRITILA